ncbi:MAG: protein-L-isoaspartate O-methyltransferase [Gammaproteobacteria bacterium]|nr:protein-L-isoaspartate O-methyltransferase [Gammaproteobacteria bacterium]
MTVLNFEEARHNMIVQQIQPWNVRDDKVLELIQRLPREDFVPAEFKEHAFTDMNIQLSSGQEMMSPKLEAYMLQALQIQDKDKILEIGTGTGYVTALLASQARHVVTVDIDAETQTRAEEKHKAHQITNISYEEGDASLGWEKQKPYDVIAITGSLPVLPEIFQRNLNVGGRLFAIVGDAPAMEALLITRVNDNEWTHQVLLETEIPALINAPKPERFVL